MNSAPLSITLKSPEETTAFAARLGSELHPGDCVLLDGPIGSGKTHFARSVIKWLMAAPDEEPFPSFKFDLVKSWSDTEDIPSPTYTLVQTYDTSAGEIWHADLYRVGVVEEVVELGMIDEFETSICLVEWPEQLGELTPKNALSIKFEIDPDHEDYRHLTISWTDPEWTPRLAKFA